MEDIVGKFCVVLVFSRLPRILDSESRPRESNGSIRVLRAFREPHDIMYDYGFRVLSGKNYIME